MALVGNEAIAVLAMVLVMGLNVDGSAEDTGCALCNCTCKEGHFMEQAGIAGFFVYLVGFACAFVAGAMTRGQRIFHCSSSKGKVFKALQDDLGVPEDVPLKNGGVQQQRANGTILEKEQQQQRLSSKQMAMGLSMMEQLVPEITHQVLTYLDFKSLCCMSMTNLAMKNAANDERAWKALFHKDFNQEQSSIVPRHGWKQHYAVTKAVTEANRQFYSKFHAKSTRGMSQLWLQADYVKCVHPGGEIISGYDAVMSSWRTVFSWSQNYEFQLHDCRVRVVGDVMAWVTSKAFINGSVEPLVSTNCYELHNEQWYIVHYHCSPQLDFAVPDYGMFG